MIVDEKDWPPGGVADGSGGLGRYQGALMDRACAWKRHYKREADKWKHDVQAWADASTLLVAWIDQQEAEVRLWKQRFTARVKTARGYLPSADDGVGDDKALECATQPTPRLCGADGGIPDPLLEQVP
jgi:hypothetical protein